MPRAVSTGATATNGEVIAAPAAGNHIRLRNVRLSGVQTADVHAAGGNPIWAVAGGALAFDETFALPSATALQVTAASHYAVVVDYIVAPDTHPVG